MQQSNTGPTSNRGRMTIGDRGRLMRMFDNFPREVRVALANADMDWSVEQVYWALRGGNKRSNIPALSAAQIVALIEKNDARNRKAA